MAAAVFATRRIASELSARVSAVAPAWTSSSAAFRNGPMSRLRGLSNSTIATLSRFSRSKIDSSLFRSLPPSGTVTRISSRFGSTPARGADAGFSAAALFFKARMCSGLTPDPPPKRLTPKAGNSAILSAKYSG